MNTIRVDEEARYADGSVAVGTRYKVLVRGTSTQHPIYADAAGTVQLPQPLVVDAQGRARFWVRPRATVTSSAAQLDIVYYDNVGAEIARQQIEPWTPEIGPWYLLTMLNSANGTGGRIPRYCKTSDGRVILEAPLTQGTSTTVASLPVGFRPITYNWIVPVGGAILSIETNGNIVIGFGVNGTNYFCNAMFWTDA